MSELVELHAIAQIPDNERHGRAASLLPLWFSMNASVLAVTTGVIGIELGASLASTVVAIVLGNLIGGLFMAYHSAQGPVLGLPQMVQSRAQFGFLGAAVPNLMAIVMYIGYYVAAGVLAGQAISNLMHVSTGLGIAIATVVTWLLAFLGYRAIHLFNRVMAVASAVLLIVLMVRVLQHLGGTHYVATANTPASFLLMLSIAASWQITFAPYVSDYTRYLPSTISTRRTFLYTYGGSVVGAGLFMSLGAIAGAQALHALSTDAVGYLSGLLPGVSGLVTLLLFFGLVASNCENLYGPYVTIMATVTRAGGRFRSELTRGIFTGVLAVLCGIIGSAVSDDFVTNLINFITFLLYLLVPWTAINLVDFYVIRKGHYDVEAILSVDGIYGRFNWRALGVYAVAAAAEVPFMNSAVYEGPIATALGGVDIAWIVGLFVAGALYLALSRTATAPSGAPVDAELPLDAAAAESARA
jgi:NCS1 family nucleobase:cation symporter-1